MTVWIVRGGRNGEFEEEALQTNTVAIGWPSVGDLADATDRQRVSSLLEKAYGDRTPRWLGNSVGKLLGFAHEMQPDDLVVMPRKGQPIIAIGEVTGAYEYRPEAQEFPHSRPVKWLNREVSKDSLDQDLLSSLSALPTIYKPRAYNAEERFRDAADERQPTSGTHPPDGMDDDLEPEPPPDLADLAATGIHSRISKNFVGHEFARLVGEVLRVQGYSAEISPPGPDGGVDIVAGSGPMGFDRPRICVQVKSGVGTVRVNVLRELEGILNNFGADYGLLVAWGGFTDDTRREARTSTYSNVRLWDSEAFLNALFEVYDRLPAEIRAKLPIKRIWILDEPEQ